MTLDEIIAARIKVQARYAIQDLARIFDIEGIEKFEGFEKIQKTICEIISLIDTVLLLPIYDRYSELDDLKE